MIRFTKLLLLLFMALASAPLTAQTTESIKELQAEMYKYFSTPEQAKFFEVTEQLKAESLEAGDEQSFYKAWGNQAIYEATHQNRNHATEIAKEMKEYAKQHESRFGEYTALHVTAAVNLQMQNYDEAEQNFLESIDYLHMFFPKESAAAAYLELTKIANRRNDMVKGEEYARKVLSEPNVAPQHKIRSLSMLCQYAFVKNEREAYNRYYDEWKQVRQLTAGGSLEPTVEVDYRIINGQYEEALALCKDVPLATRAERQATIYHRMGDDSKAYQYMLRHKHVSDSLNRVNQNTLLSDYMVQLSNERLESERLSLEEEARALRERYWLTLGAIIFSLLAYIIYRRYKTVSSLRQQNARLDEARQEADAAREEAQKALDVKREFLNNISHELRTPLNPITGFSDILATPGFELQNEERATMSQHIKESSKVLTSIIDNMIELSFYESKTSLPLEDTFSPNVIASHIVDAAQPRLGMNVKLEYISQVPDNHKITTNMQGIETVFKHLLDNALKFTDRGTVTIRCEETADMMQFSISDTGCGIPRERQEHIFDMFTNTGDSVKTTGMGLSICQAVLKLLGGRIWLDTEYTDGARFVFEIPKA